MITGALRSKIDAVWNAFWAGGIANPIEVIEQITYLLFMRGLDDEQFLAERKAARFGGKMDGAVFPEGNDPRGRPYRDLRWSVLKTREPKEMFTIVSEHVFPFLREMAEDGTSHAEHMKGARFTIPTPALLGKVVDMLDEIPLEDRDTKGDLYEYMLGKIASAGQNGQFRTPRHIIQLMVELMAPKPEDVICDPAAGTAGFLVAAGKYLRDHEPGLFRDEAQRKHFHEKMFNGFDFDATMLRIGSMNMQLHGIEDANLSYRDSLSEAGDLNAGDFTLLLANPPFSGSLDKGTISKKLRRHIKTSKTEVLFLARIVDLLRVGGRAAVIVPNGILENDGEAYDVVRRQIMNECNLEAVIALPHWTFKPYASVATSILLFKRGGPTTRTLFARIDNEGYSNGAERRPIQGSELPWLLNVVRSYRDGHDVAVAGKVRVVEADEIRSYGHDLAPSIYLSGYEYPEGMPTLPVGELFDVCAGSVPASTEEDGDYPLVTSGAAFKTISTPDRNGPAIVIPTVSSTGHGHASIKNIHYVEGPFAAATITAVLTPKKAAKINPRFAYYFLQSHKDEVLVPQMRGAANVTLSLERLRRVKIPLIGSMEDQADAVHHIESVERHMADLSRKLAEAKLEREAQIRAFKKAI